MRAGAAWENQGRAVRSQAQPSFSASWRSMGEPGEGRAQPGPTFLSASWRSQGRPSSFTAARNGSRGILWGTSKNSVTSCPLTVHETQQKQHSALFVSAARLPVVHPPQKCAVLLYRHLPERFLSPVRRTVMGFSALGNIAVSCLDIQFPVPLEAAELGGPGMSPAGLEMLAPPHSPAIFLGDSPRIGLCQWFATAPARGVRTKFQQPRHGG